MWLSPLLALLLFTMVVGTPAQLSFAAPNRTLPYPNPARYRRAPVFTPLMQELMGPDGGKRTIRYKYGGYVTVVPYRQTRTEKWTGKNGQYWTIRPINDFEVALRASNGYHVSHSDFNYAGYAKEALEWEMLTPVKNDDGTWSFKSRWNKWLSIGKPDMVFASEKTENAHWWLELWH